MAQVLWCVIFFNIGLELNSYFRCNISNHVPGILTSGKTMSILLYFSPTKQCFISNRIHLVQGFLIFLTARATKQLNLFCNPENWWTPNPKSLLKRFKGYIFYLRNLRGSLRPPRKTRTRLGPSIYSKFKITSEKNRNDLSPVFPSDRTSSSYTDSCNPSGISEPHHSWGNW